MSISFGLEGFSSNVRDVGTCLLVTMRHVPTAVKIYNHRHRNLRSHINISIFDYAQKLYIKIWLFFCKKA